MAPGVQPYKYISVHEYLKIIVLCLLRTYRKERKLIFKMLKMGKMGIGLKKKIPMLKLSLNL